MPARAMSSQQLVSSLYPLPLFLLSSPHQKGRDKARELTGTKKSVYSSRWCFFVGFFCSPNEESMRKFVSGLTTPMPIYPLKTGFLGHYHLSLGYMWEVIRLQSVPRFQLLFHLTYMNLYEEYSVYSWVQWYSWVGYQRCKAYPK